MSTPARRAALRVIVAALVLGGCDPGAAAPSPPTVAATPSALTTTEASAPPSPPSPPPTEIPVPTASAVPTATPPPTPRPAGYPPDALLAAEGGDPVAGEIGSYTWLNAGSDSPWLPGNPITVGAGETLTVTIEPAVNVEQWTASREVWQVLPGGGPTVGVGQGGPGQPITFTAPPPGLWALDVSVWFTGGRGSAAYYWKLEVR